MSATFLRSDVDFTPIQLMYNNGWQSVNVSQNKNHQIKKDLINEEN